MMVLLEQHWSDEFVDIRSRIESLEFLSDVS